VILYQDQFTARLDSRRAEWEQDLREKLDKARERLSKLLTKKRIEEVRLRESADKVVSDFVEAVDGTDSRKRAGFLATLTGVRGKLACKRHSTFPQARAASDPPTGHHLAFCTRDDGVYLAAQSRLIC